VTDEEQLQFGCPVCAADRAYAEATDARRDDGEPYAFTIYRCTVCDFQFVDPRSYPLRRGRPAH
jgi:transposase-like protein